MSAGSLFHTVAAATAKALVPMMVFVRCTNSFMVSVDRKCRLRTVEAKTQLSAKFCGARPCGAIVLYTFYCMFSFRLLSILAGVSSVCVPDGVIMLHFIRNKTIYRLI